MTSRRRNDHSVPPAMDNSMLHPQRSRSCVNTLEREPTSTMHTFVDPCREGAIEQQQQQRTMTYRARVGQERCDPPWAQELHQQQHQEKAQKSIRKGRQVSLSACTSV